MITDYFAITEKRNRLQVIMITDYNNPISDNIMMILRTCIHAIKKSSSVF